MAHYLSLSKKLGGFAAIAAFLLLLNGCGGGSSNLAVVSRCSKFMQASHSDRVQLATQMYEGTGGSSGQAAATAVVEAENTCRSAPAERLEELPSLHAATVTTPATTAATTTPTYPAVKFATDADGGEQETPERGQTVPVMPDPTKGAWPFSVQLLGITTSLNGFSPGLQTPRGYEMMMVQVNITNLTPGRIVPIPQPEDIKLFCTGPNSQSWQMMPDEYGYTEDPAGSPNSAPEELNFQSGQPIAWDREWQVPEGTNVADTKCEWEWEQQRSPLN